MGEGKPMWSFRSVILVSAAALGGCTMTLLVSGIVQNSDETFTGTATGGLDRAGTLSIVSSKGASCEGNFVYVTSRTGEGVFNCSDGRSGPFRFVSTGIKGTGQGNLGGEAFTFTFGS